MTYRVPRIQVLPLPDDQVSFVVDGQEKLRWHAAKRYPRPFFYPIVGPDGQSVTRMGHPAAPDHDHHRSCWLGHNTVGGVNFWEERGGQQQVRQESWVHYQDGDDEAGMVVNIGWHDSHNVRLLQQELIATLRPGDSGEQTIELQSTFRSAIDGLKLARTNFGFMGLRVARSLSAHYGGGVLTNSEGLRTEKLIHEKPARWVDYSGPTQGERWQGVTWFDHPQNPNHPTSWHTRDDGWFSPAFNLREEYVFQKTTSLTLRYLLHVHLGAVTPSVAELQAAAFARTPAWQVRPAQRPWRVRLARKTQV